jgi:hypothetical protein
MSKRRTAKGILSDVSGHQGVAESRCVICEQLTGIVAQLRMQADSTFDGKTWVEAGHPGLGECLQTTVEALIELAKRWRVPPEWVKAQQRAYDASALCQLQKAEHARGTTKLD